MTPSHTNNSLVSKKWENDFIVELRLAEVDGAALGDALEHVRSFCADSGQDAETAFGDPTEYARSLALPTQGRATSVRIASTTLIFSSTGMAGMAIALATDAAWRQSSDTAITIGGLISGVLGVVALSILAFAPGVMRGLVRHPLVSFFVFFAVVAAVVAPIILLTTTVFEVPVVISAVVAAVLLIGSATCQTINLRKADDPILSPSQPERVEPSRGKLAVAMVAWVIPIGTVFLLVVQWLMLPA